MSVITEAEVLALSLPAKARGELITKLLRSLPKFPSDEDDSVNEALRRREEMRKTPEIAISLQELDKRMKGRFE